MRLFSGVVSEGSEYLPAMDLLGFYFYLLVAEVSRLAAYVADRAGGLQSVEASRKFVMRPD